MDEQGASEMTALQELQRRIGREDSASKVLRMLAEHFALQCEGRKPRVSKHTALDMTDGGFRSHGRPLHKMMVTVTRETESALLDFVGPADDALRGIKFRGPSMPPREDGTYEVIIACA